MMDLDNTMVRTGDFTSSSIHKLCANGKGSALPVSFNSYVKEKARETVSGRELSNEARSVELEWGNLCEPLVFDMLSEQDINYKDNLDDKIRHHHPDLPWSGAADYFKNDDLVGDIKSPFTLASWYDQTEWITPELMKKHKKEYYWQLVSNSILSNRPIAEKTLFMPKQSRISSIMERAIDIDSFIQYKEYSQIPWHHDNSIAPELFKIQFEVPKDDIDLALERVTLASVMKKKEVEKLKERLCKQN